MFFNGQPIQELGLRVVDLNSRRTAAVVARMHNELNAYLGRDASGDLYYTFGWNGLLSQTKRYQAARIFYQELKDELAQLKLLGIIPTLRIITYSHGGNVALNLPAIAFERDEHVPFVVDELVLLGMPVQTETDFLICDPLFKKIYHIYSDADVVQSLDIFSSAQFFPKKKFRSHGDFIVPEKKLRQIKFRVTSQVCGKKRVKSKDGAPDFKVLESKHIRLVHHDPVHTELWNFSWGSRHYRKRFSIKPLPVVALIPAIISHVDEHTKNPHVTFDYCPRYGAVLFTEGTHGKYKKAVAFYPEKLPLSLQELAAPFEPKEYNVQEQDRRMRHALKNARKELKSSNHR